MVALRRVVVDDVEDHLDTVLVQRLDHRLELVELGPELGGGGVAEVRREEADRVRSEEHTSELQSQSNLVCRLLLEKKKISPYVGYFSFDVHSQQSLAFNRPALSLTVTAFLEHSTACDYPCGQTRTVIKLFHILLVT